MIEKITSPVLLGSSSRQDRTGQQNRTTRLPVRRRTQPHILDTRLPCTSVEDPSPADENYAGDMGSCKSQLDPLIHTTLLYSSILYYHHH